MSRQNLIRLQEAADLCSIDSHTLKRWMAKGHIRPRHAHHGLFVDRRELRRCLLGRGFPVPPELQGKPSVLVADDEAEIRQLVAWTLRALWPQAAIERARDGNEAVRKLLELSPDLLITDLRMPGPDGMMICRTIQNNRELAHTKILALTGFDDPETQAEIFESGAHEYLLKPFEPQDLCDSAMRLLGIGPGMPH